MAIKDITRKPYIVDRDNNVFIGIDYPFHRSTGVEGWFKSTSTTIDAVKNNIKLLLQTERGERKEPHRAGDLSVYRSTAAPV